MSDSEVKFCCETLRELVQGILDPASCQQLRSEAQQFCNDFKEKSSMCVPCGLILAEKTEASIVRFFGLQILEHVVACRWPTMSAEDRESLKSRFVHLISEETAFLEGETYIRDAAARIMLEMIKHEWPVHWSMMLFDLATVSDIGALQAELVLFVLLRLAEDVVTFRKLSQPSLDVLKSALDQNMNSIFRIVEHLLTNYVREYDGAEPSLLQVTQVQSYGVVLAAINTLAGYMEWVHTRHISHKVVKMLWRFLNDPKLQLPASECLLVAIDRIGSGIGIFVLFSKLPIVYLSPVKVASGQVPTEQHFFFLKRQCQLLCVFGKQLCLTMDSYPSMKIPSNFRQFLEILLYFTTHSSKVVSSLTQSTWRLLFEHALFSCNFLVLTMLPRYLRTTRMNLAKVGFPSQNNSPSCEYSRLEFVCDDDFCEFLTTFHDDQRMVIEAACRIDQRTCFQIVVEFLKYQLAASGDTGPMKAVTGDGSCLSSTQSLQQCEATIFFVTVVIETLFKNLKTQDIPVNDCKELLQLAMKFKTREPLIFTCVQTNISTIFPFLTSINECPSQILSEVLGMISTMSAPKEQSLTSVRRSACSCFIQLCRDNAQSLRFHFEVLNERVKQLLDSKKLIQLEKITLLEAMVIIINQFKNYKQQKALLEELMAPVTSVWLSKEMKKVFYIPGLLIKYVGANLQVRGSDLEIESGRNRSRIIYCLSTILGVLKWSQWPTDLEEAKAGGFVIDFMPNGTPIYSNPCTEQVQQLLENLLFFIRTQHRLFSPESKTLFSGSYVKALDQLELKNTSTLDHPQPLLDIYDPTEYKTDLESMHAFFCTSYEICFSILGQAGSSMNNDFYTRKGFLEALLQFSIPDCKIIPCYRLLSMLRAFWKPLVHCCPPEYYETFLCHLIKQFLECSHTRLSDEWDIINKGSTAVKRYTVKKLASQKIQENQVKLLTREVTEFIFVCCVSNEVTSVIAASSDACSVSTEDADNTICTAESDDDAIVCTEDTSAVAAVSAHDGCVPVENEEPGAVRTVEFDDGELAAEVPLLPQPASPELSELGEITEPAELTLLGVCLLKTKSCCSSLLHTAFSCLLWNDSLTCYKIATRLCWPLLKEVTSKPVSAGDMAYLFSMVLGGIQRHNDINFSSDPLVHMAFHIYEYLCPRCEEFSEVMEKVSNIQSFYLEQFDLGDFSYKIQERNNMLKDDFKHLIKECTKKPSEKTFQDDWIHIPEPPILKRSNPPNPVEDPNHLSPPPKKLFPTTLSGSPVMFAEGDHLSDSDFFP